MEKSVVINQKKEKLRCTPVKILSRPLVYKIFQLHRSKWLILVAVSHSLSGGVRTAEPAETKLSQTAFGRIYFYSTVQVVNQSPSINN